MSNTAPLEQWRKDAADLRFPKSYREEALRMVRKLERQEPKA